MTVMLSGCLGSSDGPSAPLQVSLPAPPAYMQPVPVPNVHKGQDARQAVAQARQSLSQANGRLTESRSWYETLRKDYAK